MTPNATHNDAPLRIIEPVDSLEVRSPSGRRYPTELRLDVSGPELEIFVPYGEDDEDCALDAEPEVFGVFEASTDGRLYWTIPLLGLDEAKRLLAEARSDAEQVVAGSKCPSPGFVELDEAAWAAVDRIASRCAGLTPAGS